MARRIGLFLSIITLSVVGADFPLVRQAACAAGLDKNGETEAKEATRLFKQGLYEEAAQIYVKLSLDYPSMDVFERNLGACFYHMRKPEPALSNLRRYLGRKKDIEAEDKATVDRWIDEMEKLRAQNEAASVATRPPGLDLSSAEAAVPSEPQSPRPIRLRLLGDSEGLIFWVEDLTAPTGYRRLCKAPCEVSLSAGKMTLALSDRENAEPKSAGVVLAKGNTVVRGRYRDLGKGMRTFNLLGWGILATGVGVAGYGLLGTTGDTRSSLALTGAIVAAVGGMWVLLSPDTNRMATASLRSQPE